MTMNNRLQQRAKIPSDGPPADWIAPQTMPFDPNWVQRAEWWHSNEPDVVRAGIELLQRAWLSAGFLPASMDLIATETFHSANFLDRNQSVLFRDWVLMRIDDGRDMYAHPGMARLCAAIHRQHREDLAAIMAQQAVAALGSPNMNRIRRTLLPDGFELTPARRAFMARHGVSDPEHQESVFSDFVSYARASGQKMHDWDVYFEANVGRRLTAAPRRVAGAALSTRSMNQSAIDAVLARRGSARRDTERQGG